MKKGNTIKKIYAKISQHNMAAIFLILGLLFVAEYMAYQWNPHKSILGSVVKQYYFVPAFEDAQEYYATYDQPLQTDEYMMYAILWPEQLDDVDKVFTKDPFDRIYRNDAMINNFSVVRRVDSGEEVIDLYLAEGVDTPLYVIDERYKDTMTDPTDEMIVKALYCDVLGYDDFDEELLGLMRDNEGGYGDTHYLLGLLLLEKLGCSTAEEVFDGKKEVIKAIVAAQEQDQSFSDLFAERIVVLFWAGHGDAVDVNWIEKIVKEQRGDGGWQDSGDMENNPHTTGLSALAIKYFNDGALWQDVLVQ